MCKPEYELLMEIKLEINFNNIVGYMCFFCLKFSSLSVSDIAILVTYVEH